MKLRTESTANDWHDDQYRALGFGAQRRYPNEEFVRFLAGHFFHVPRDQRRSVCILEVGSGSGANLWAVAREGFDAYGLDISAAGAALCQEVLESWGVSAKVEVGDMAAIPGASNRFHGVADVYSSYCLDEQGFSEFLDSVHRVLRPGGKFFSFTPSKNSDAFKDHAPATLIDSSTLSGIYRSTSPYIGSHHPFRFIAPEEYVEALHRHGLRVLQCETTTRTYRSRVERFEFVVVVAERP